MFHSKRWQILRKFVFKSWKKWWFASFDGFLQPYSNFFKIIIFRVKSRSSLFFSSKGVKKKKKLFASFIVLKILHFDIHLGNYKILSLMNLPDVRLLPGSPLPPPPIKKIRWDLKKIIFRPSPVNKSDSLKGFKFQTLEGAAYFLIWGDNRNLKSGILRKWSKKKIGKNLVPFILHVKCWNFLRLFFS